MKQSITPATSTGPRQTRQTVLFTAARASQAAALISSPAESAPSTLLPSRFVATKKPRAKSSPLWAYADHDDQGNPSFSSTPGRESQVVYRCKLCIVNQSKNIKEYDAPGSGAHFRDHLHKRHNVVVQIGIEATLEKYATEAERITELQTWNSNVRVGGKRERSNTASDVDPVMLRALFLNWVVRDNLPFTCNTPQTSRILQPTHFCHRSRSTTFHSSSKTVFDFSFGRLSVLNQEAKDSSGHCRNKSAPKRSRATVFFVPAPLFWQKIIHLQIEWTARRNSFQAPILSLQLLDIVQDNHPVIKASICGDTEALKSTLSGQNASPLCSTIAGWTPLHYAAAYGNLSACRLLITHGAPLCATGFRGITPLHLAAHFGRPEVFKALIKAGSDPNSYHEHGLNAMFEILSNETVSGSSDLPELIKWLLFGQDHYLLDTQATDNYKRGILYYLANPPGHHAAWSLPIALSETFANILRDSANGDEFDILGISLLHEACRDGRLDLVKLLLTRPCKLNAKDKRGYTPLHYAVESRDLDIISALVIHGAEVNIIAKSDWSEYEPRYRHVDPTPLLLAARLNWIEALEYLIQHGAAGCDECISNAFHAAIESNSMHAVQYFIENNIDQLGFYETIKKAMFSGNTAMIEVLYKHGAPLDDHSDGLCLLALVAFIGSVRVTEKLIELGADFDEISKGLTPLGHAAAYGHGDIVQVLLTIGAQADLTGYQMPTPMQLAINNGFDEIADEIRRSTRISSSQRDFVTFSKSAAAEDRVDEGEVPFCIDADWEEIAIKNNLKLAERLVEQGWSLEAERKFSRSPLQSAIVWHSWTIAEKLVEAGANVNSRYKNENNWDEMPFLAAVRHGNVALIELMIRHGADVNFCSKEGSTPLLETLSALHGPPHHFIIRVLLDTGAHVNVVDKYGRTPLGKAAAVGNLEAVELLVKAGAELNGLSLQNPAQPADTVTKWVYRTPLSWAALGGHDDVVKFLFDSGAEWRSLPKEPALTYTHRLLMQSWFPEKVEDPVERLSGVDLLSVPPRNAAGK